MPNSSPVDPIIAFFKPVKVTNKRQRNRDQLETVIGQTIYAVIQGAKSFDDIENISLRQFDWLKEHLPIPNTMPKRLAIEAVLTDINHSVFECCFRAWSDYVCELEGTLIPLSSGALWKVRTPKNRRIIRMVHTWFKLNYENLPDPYKFRPENPPKDLWNRLDVVGAFKKIPASEVEERLVQCVDCEEVIEELKKCREEEAKATADLKTCRNDARKAAATAAADLRTCRNDATKEAATAATALKTCRNDATKEAATAATALKTCQNNATKEAATAATALKTCQNDATAAATTAAAALETCQDDATAAATTAAAALETCQDDATAAATTAAAALETCQDDATAAAATAAAALETCQDDATAAAATAAEEIERCHEALKMEAEENAKCQQELATAAEEVERCQEEFKIEAEEKAKAQQEAKTAKAALKECQEELKKCQQEVVELKEEEMVEKEIMCSIEAMIKGLESGVRPTRTYLNRTEKDDYNADIDKLPSVEKLDELIKDKINENKLAEFEFQRTLDKTTADQSEVANRTQADETYDAARCAYAASHNKFDKGKEKACLQLRLDVNTAILAYKKSITKAREACPPPDIPERKRILYAEKLREQVAKAATAYLSTMQKLRGTWAADACTWQAAKKTYTYAYDVAEMMKTDTYVTAEVTYWTAIDKDWPPPPA